jgi:serine/threonine protein kinase
MLNISEQRFMFISLETPPTYLTACFFYPMVEEVDSPIVREGHAMVSTELGACEWFVWDLRRSNLIDRGQLDQIIGEFLTKHPRAEPPELAEFLVGKGILTDFQSERLLQGKTQGFVLGPFTLMDALGAGSMGTVYKAQSKTDNLWYAVKVLPRRSMWNVRIARRKVRAFEHARHPSVVPFVDVGTAGGMHYLAWPFVEGETLDKVMAREGKFVSGLAAHYAVQVAEGLDVCHQQGLIHGLLKPSNLMIDAEQQVKILDFGIGCLLAETEGESLVDTMSTANSVASGLDCSSPESIMDPTNLTPAGDQYSLGCVLYFMLTGQYPFPDGSAAEKMMAHQFKEPTPIGELNPEVPAELVEVVARLMKKTADERYGAAGEIVEALRPFAKVPSAAPAKARALPGRAATAAPKQAAPAIAEKPKAKPASTGSAGAPQPSVSVSTPTPKPQAMGSLPTRSSLKGTAAPPPAPPKPEPKPEPVQALDDDGERIVPGDIAGEEPRTSWDDRLGPVGVAVAAIAACALVYFVVAFFKLF